MLKPMMLLGAAMIAAPALAQNKPVNSDVTSGRAPIAASQATPAADQTVTNPAQQTATMPQQAASAPQQTTAPTTPAPGDMAAAQPATAQPASEGDQIATVVDSEFPTYDKDGNGKLTKAEFGAWMVALKAKSDPSAKADAPATKTWVAGAFKQADTDKNAAVSKVELTNFLSQGKSQG